MISFFVCFDCNFYTFEFYPNKSTKFLLNLFTYFYYKNKLVAKHVNFLRINFILKYQKIIVIFINFIFVIQLLVIFFFPFTINIAIVFIPFFLFFVVLLKSFILSFIGYLILLFQHHKHLFWFRFKYLFFLRSYI